MKRLPIIICFCMVALFSSCKHQPQIHSRILQLYSQIKTGMSQQEVEKILGAPLFPALHQPEVGPEYLGPGGTHPEGDVCWYIREMEKGPYFPSGGSWGPGGIMIVYRSGKVIQKIYNIGWINEDDLRAFEEMNAPNKKGCIAAERSGASNYTHG
jgi:hypothetical protein